MRRIKGQYRAISEILLFSIGIMVTGYVIINFDTLRSGVKEISVRDQLENIADAVSSAVVKVANANNATARLAIPDRVSGSLYRVAIRDADGGKIVIMLLDGSATIERQLFNINYDNTNNSSGVVNNSEVASSAQFIEVIKNEKITLRRVPLKD